MDMRSELGTELKKLVGLANQNKLFNAAEWLAGQLAKHSRTAGGQPANDPIVKVFQKGDPCNVCDDGMIVGQKSLETKIGGRLCNGYCLNCGQRYDYPE